MEIVIFIVVAAVLWHLISLHNMKKRSEASLHKCRDAEVVDRIMDRIFLQGQIQEQLIDYFGSPVNIDAKVLKKTKEKWKH